jgi:iron complex transport system substrate-binding protein
MATVPLLRTAALGALALVLAAGGQAGAAAPRRIVSLNLCTDQLVLALADRGQIAGLTVNAVDREMSAEADRARGLRLLGTSAEEVLGLDPDLVVGMPARGSPQMRLLAGQRYRMLDVRPADRLEDIYAAIRETAAAVGHPERGEALIARMRRELAAIPRVGGGRVAAYYQRRGFLTGTGTLIDDLMRRLGLFNLASRLGKPVLAQVSLEEMVAARPDYLIVESATDRVVDQGTEMLHHTALAGIPRISVPEAWTVCGGPAYVLAARSIARQIAAIRSDAAAPRRR